MAKVQEVVNIHFGNAGIQIGDYCCQLFAEEHQINTEEETQNPFFDKDSRGKTTANSIFVDMDPITIERISRGRTKELYNPRMFVGGVEDGASNYARGYFLVNDKALEGVQEQTRKITESKDNFQGFLVTHSTGGGTGSGFVNLVMEKLEIEYGDKTKVSFTVLPGDEQGRNLMEVYNTVLFFYKSKDFFDASFLFDNDACYSICEKQLRIPHPKFVHMNELVAQTISSITASMRFNGGMNKFLKEFPRNFVPYPDMRFPVPAYGPLIDMDEKGSLNNLSLDLLKPGNQLVDVDLTDSKSVTCCYLYRGGIQMKDANHAIKYVKSKKILKFPPIPFDAYKVSVVKEAAVRLKGSIMPKSITKQSVCALNNGTSACQIFSSLLQKYEMLRKEQAYIHWLVQEGLEEVELKDAEDDLKILNNEYLRLVNQ